MGKRRVVPKEDEPGLDMSSLIDVSFLLLIYFLVTSTIDPKETDLGMTLPTTTALPQTEVKMDQLTITINTEGHILVGDDVYDTDPNDRDVPLLSAKVSEYSQGAKMSNEEPIVVVSADDASKSQRFVDVLNALAKHGIKNVTITGFVENP